MRPKLESTNIAIRDIADQPPSPYILILEGILGTKAAFAVAEVRDQSGMFVAYGPAVGQDANVRLLSFPYQTNWALVTRAAFELMPVETWERKRAEDIRAAKALEKEIYPQHENDGSPTGGPIAFVPLAGAGYDPGFGAYA